MISATHYWTMMLLNVLIFASPSIAMTTFKTAIDRLNTAWGNRANGIEAETELINALAAMIVILNSLANYIGSIALGNFLTIQKAGMQATFTEKNKAVRPVQAETPKGKSSTGAIKR